MTVEEVDDGPPIMHLELITLKTKLTKLKYVEAPCIAPVNGKMCGVTPTILCVYHGKDALYLDCTKDPNFVLAHLCDAHRDISTPAQDYKP